MFLPVTQQPHSGLSRLPVEVSTAHYPQTHSDTSKTVGIIWTRNRPLAKIFVWKHTAFPRDGHSWPRREWNPQPQQASDRNPTP